MSSHAKGTFEVESWDERTYTEINNGKKLTQASVTQIFTGDIEGDGAVEWLMFYRENGTADFVGLQRIVGQIGNRPGSFVLQTTGTFNGSEAKGTWSVVPGSGTDDLQNLQGEGNFTAPLGSKAAFTLDYVFK